MKSHNFTYFFWEGVQNIFLHGLMSLAAVGVTMACLIIVGSFTLASVNLEATISEYEQENQVVAFVDETYTEDAARAIEDSIRAVANVADCRFVTRQEAMDEFLSKYDDDSVFASVPTSALRDRYEIHLNDLESMEQTKTELEGVTGVADVRADLEIAEGFTTVRNMTGVVTAILAILLLLVSLFIISNTVRLGAFTRRDEVAILKMCGARDAFIRWPFVLEGVVLGIIGALVAFFIQWGVYGLVLHAISNTDTLKLLTMIPFGQLAGRVLAWFILVGLVIGALGSSLAINKFLKV